MQTHTEHINILSIIGFTILIVYSPFLPDRNPIWLGLSGFTVVVYAVAHEAFLGLIFMHRFGLLSEYNKNW